MKLMITDVRTVHRFNTNSDTIQLYAYSIGPTNGLDPEVSSFVSDDTLSGLMRILGTKYPIDLVGFRFQRRSGRSAIESFSEVLREAQLGRSPKFDIEMDPYTHLLEQTIQTLASVTVPDFRPSRHERFAERMFQDLFRDDFFVAELCRCVSQRNRGLQMSCSEIMQPENEQRWVRIIKLTSYLGGEKFILYQYGHREPFALYAVEPMGFKTIEMSVPA